MIWEPVRVCNSASLDGVAWGSPLRVSRGESVMLFIGEAISFPRCVVACRSVAIRCVRIQGAETKKPPYLGGCGGLKLGCVLRSAGHRTRANKLECEAHDADTHRGHRRKTAGGGSSARRHGGGSSSHRRVKPAPRQQTRQVRFCSLIASFSITTQNCFINLVQPVAQSRRAATGRLTSRLLCRFGFEPRKLVPGKGGRARCVHWIRGSHAEPGGLFSEPDHMQALRRALQCLAQ